MLNSDNTDAKISSLRMELMTAIDGLSHKLMSTDKEFFRNEHKMAWGDGYFPSTGIDYSIFKFGFKIDPTDKTKVIVSAGELQWGKKVLSIATTTITIDTDGTYIGMESNGTTAVIVKSTSLSDLRSDDEKFRTWFTKWSFVDGKAKIKEIGHIGNVINPSTYTAI